jgi:hypothetical protein
MKLFEWFSNGKAKGAAIPATPAILPPETDNVPSKTSKNSGNSDGCAFPQPTLVARERELYINKIDKFITADERIPERERTHASTAIPAIFAIPARRPTAPLPWHGRMQTLADWFLAHVDELPTAPFDLGVGVHIVEPAKCYAMLRRDLAGGPNGPRAKTGALEADLTALMERWAIQQEDRPMTTT